MIYAPTIKSWAIFLGLVAGFSLAAWSIGLGVLLSLGAITIALNCLAFFFAKDIILYFGDKLFKKQEAGDSIDGVSIYQLTDNLLKEHSNFFPGMSLENNTIEIYLLDNNMINAFASGRSKNHAMVCVTKGLLRELTKDGKIDEKALKAILLHELAHIRHHHTLKGTISDILISLLELLETLPCALQQKLPAILNILLFPLSIFGASLSRQREYESDATATKCGYGDGLKRGLAIISEGIHWHTSYENTARGFIRSLANLIIEFFQSHPNVKNRILAIEQEQARMDRNHLNGNQERTEPTQGLSFGQRFAIEFSETVRSEFNGYASHFRNDKGIVRAKITP